MRVVDRAEDVAGGGHVVGRDLEDRVVDASCRAAASSATCSSYALPVGERVGEDRRVGGHADDVAVVDELLQAARDDALARQVVEPDADAGGGELGGGVLLVMVLSLLVRWSARVRRRGGERLLGGGDGGLGGDAELRGTGSCSRPMRRSARSTRCGRASPTYVRPGEGEPGLDRDAGLDGCGQHRLAVLGVLLVEPLQARRRHDAGVDALGLERLARLDGELHLGAGGDEDDVGRAVRRLGEHVGALRRRSSPRRRCRRRLRRRRARTPGCSGG